MSVRNPKFDVHALPWLLIISGHMMAINNFFIVITIVSGRGIQTRNAIVFGVCVAIWLATSFAARPPWWVVFLKHLIYSSGMLGVYLMMFGMYLVASHFSQAERRLPNIEVSLVVLFAGFALYEGMRRVIRWAGPRY